MSGRKHIVGRNRIGWLIHALRSLEVKATLLIATLAMLSACGGNSDPASQAASSQLAGNWQFTMVPPSDNSFIGGLQGGFLLQPTLATITGSVVYSISLPPLGSNTTPTLCNSGSAPVTGTVNGQNVTLTAVAGPQTFTLAGTLNGTTIMGTYSSGDGKGCGTAQNNLQWSATLVPALSGTVQGYFHSVLNPALKNQIFPVSGSITQGQNIGASSATVTGTLNFQNYPCLASAAVNGQVSGNSVILQIIGSNGLNAGQIGAPSGFSNPSPVTLLSSTAGEAVQGSNGYGVSTSSCPSGNAAGDIGDVCLGIGSATVCTQPILMSPATLTFPPQQVGSLPSTQTITLTNNTLSSNPLSGLTISLATFNPAPGITSPFGASDFTGLPDFMEQDNCSQMPGASFALNSQESCIITISFAPQQSCPWLPSTALGGEPPSACPFPLQAALTVVSPVSSDSNTSFAMPLNGIGFSAIIPSTPELDFGAEAVGESSTPQNLSFFNQGANPVQILPALSTPCVNPAHGIFTLARPLGPGAVSGLQVDEGSSIVQNGSTINYLCDNDLTSHLPNFQITADGCSGTLLTPQGSCSLQILFAPQPSTPLTPALDDFLELNTLQCTSSITSNCEIDSGRFPVELKANLPSPLRMTPAAGVNFGNVVTGVTSSPVTVTLFNDPKDPNSSTINFTGNILQGTAFTETDNCAGSLPPGGSCAVNVSFTPKGLGYKSGTVTIGYTVGQTQTIFLRGTGVAAQ